MGQDITEVTGSPASTCPQWGQADGTYVFSLKRGRKGHGYCLGHPWNCLPLGGVNPCICIWTSRYRDVFLIELLQVFHTVFKNGENVFFFFYKILSWTAPWLPFPKLWWEKAVCPRGDGNREGVKKSWRSAIISASPFVFLPNQWRSLRGCIRTHLLEEWL